MAGATRNGGSAAIDTFIHSELLFLKLPVLFLNAAAAPADRLGGRERAVRPRSRVDGKLLTDPA